MGYQQAPEPGLSHSPCSHCVWILPFLKAMPGLHFLGLPWLPTDPIPSSASTYPSTVSTGPVLRVAMLSSVPGPRDLDELSVSPALEELEVG